MALSSQRKHNIYLLATIGCELVSDNPEEIAYYKKVTAKITKDKK